MMHVQGVQGYWGVSKNPEFDKIIVLVGDAHEQARVVLTIEQAEKMISEIQRNILATKLRKFGDPKCKYCENIATKTLTWLFDRKHQPARIEVRWCGCDLQEALKRFWPNPYKVIEGLDYEVQPLELEIVDGLPEADH